MSRRKRSVLSEILGGVMASAEQTPAGEDSAGGATAAPEKPKSRPAPKPARPRPPRALPQWNVILLDDDDHSYDYVIEMLGCVFGHGLERAFTMAREVDSTGRVVVFTTHRELAELKREQIIGYGTDPRISTSRGGMAAIIEPARG